MSFNIGKMDKFERVSQLATDRKTWTRSQYVTVSCLAVVLIISLGLSHQDLWRTGALDRVITEPMRSSTSNLSPYGQFPDPNDPFHFIPCTSTSLPPSLDDSDPEASWAKLFDPNPSHWSWGKAPSNATKEHCVDPYADRAIYLCGYLDVPLDYTNTSDKRITRLAMTKLQVSGLLRKESSSEPAKKSERTIVIEPGGPGGSGTSNVPLCFVQFQKPRALPHVMGARLSAQLYGLRSPFRLLNYLEKCLANRDNRD